MAGLPCHRTSHCLLCACLSAGSSFTSSPPPCLSHFIPLPPSSFHHPRLAYPIYSSAAPTKYLVLLCGLGSHTQTHIRCATPHPQSVLPLSFLPTFYFPQPPHTLSFHAYLFSDSVWWCRQPTTNSTVEIVQSVSVLFSSNSHLLHTLLCCHDTHTPYSRVTSLGIG